MNDDLDLYAQWTRERETARSDLLREQAARTPSTTLLPLDPAPHKACYSPGAELGEADLEREVKRIHQAYRKYLKREAPALPSQRVARPLPTWDYRLETAEDRLDLLHTLGGQGDWESVTVPHYGPPGEGAWYRTKASLTTAMLDRGRQFLVLPDGAEGCCSVFVNGHHCATIDQPTSCVAVDFTAHARLGENLLLVRLSLPQDQAGASQQTLVSPGWDEPGAGHRCERGLGILGPVRLESRGPVYLQDVFVRVPPRGSGSEAGSGTGASGEIWLEVVNTNPEPVERSFRLSLYAESSKQDLFVDRAFAAPGPLLPGLNTLRFRVDLAKTKTWTLDDPHLYRIHAKLISPTTKVLDSVESTFGVRDFTLDTRSMPRGTLSLNGSPVQLRGTDSVAHLLRAALDGGAEAVLADLLVLKALGINTLRLRGAALPKLIVDLCDRLGLLVHTVLPLPGLGYGQIPEAVLLVSATCRRLRTSPSAVLLSLFDTPSADALWREYPRADVERFLTAIDQVVRLLHPTLVVQPVVADQDPPAPGLPDLRVDLSLLPQVERGGLPPLKAGYGLTCALTPEHLPSNQASAVVRRFVGASRREPRMIGAFLPAPILPWSSEGSNTAAASIEPDGSLALLSADRSPLPAAFALLNAWAPVSLSLAPVETSPTALEIWVHIDRKHTCKDPVLVYQLEVDSKVFAAGRTRVTLPPQGSQCLGLVAFPSPPVKVRSEVVIRAALLDGRRIVQETQACQVVWPSLRLDDAICVIGPKHDPLVTLLESLGANLQGRTQGIQRILISDPAALPRRQQAIEAAVQAGATAVLLQVPVGPFTLAGHALYVEASDSGPVRGTTHPCAAQFRSEDFPHNASTSVLSAPGARILEGPGGCVAVDLPQGAGHWRICQWPLVPEHPASAQFLVALLGGPTVGGATAGNPTAARPGVDSAPASTASPNPGAGDGEPRDETRSDPGDSASDASGSAALASAQPGSASDSAKRTTSRGSSRSASPSRPTSPRRAKPEAPAGPRKAKRGTKASPSPSLVADEAHTPEDSPQVDVTDATSTTSQDPAQGEAPKRSRRRHAARRKPRNKPASDGN